MRLRLLGSGLLVAAGVVLACTTDTKIGPDAALESLSIVPASAVIVLDDTLRLAAVGIDRNGRRFADARARWATSDAAISLSATGVAIGLRAGAATVRATVGGKTATATVTVQPKPAFTTSRDSVPFDAIANGPTPTTQTVLLTNGGGGTLAPRLGTITYGPGASGWLNAALSGLVAPDTLALAVVNTALPVGTYTATIVLTAARATNSPKAIKVTLAVALGAPSTMTADSGDGQAATVNTPVAVPPVVRVRDQYGNRIPGVSVTFTVTGGGGSVVPTAPVATDANGRARVTSWTLGTGAGTNTLQASVTALTPVTFTATGVAQTNVSPTQSSVTAATGTITACSSGCVAGSTASTITVTVRDGFSNPIGGAAVTLSSTGTNNTLSPVSGMTSAGGTFTATFTSTTAEAKTISATADAGAGNVPISQTAAVTVGAAAATTMSLNGGNNQSARVGTAVSTNPSVLVTDAFGNPKAGVAVTFTPSGGGGVTGSPASTSGLGIATVTSWTMGSTGVENADGTFTNNLSAAASGTNTVPFTGTGFYTWAGDARPLIGAGTSCSGCHVSWSMGPPQDAAGTQNLVGFAGTGGCAAFTRVVAGNAGSSMLYSKLASASPVCGAPMPPAPGIPFAAASLKIIRAWINNGAPNN
jgi:hypothetical protein